MTVSLSHKQAQKLWHEVSLSLVREGIDLSARQMAILLTIYTDLRPHTVRGLAERLGVSKPVITRALDTMGGLNLVSRQRDPADRRNVTIRRTASGVVFMDQLADIIVARAGELTP